MGGGKDGKGRRPDKYNIYANSKTISHVSHKSCCFNQKTIVYIDLLWTRLHYH